MATKREPRSGRLKRWLGAALGVMLGLGAFSGAAFAAGTAAGTLLITKVTGTYQDSNGNTKDTNDATSTITVRQVAGVTATEKTASKFLRVGTHFSYAVTVTNTGNKADTFDLAAVMDSIAPSGSATAGWSVQVLKTADTTSSAITKTDLLAPDAAQTVYVYVSVPADALDGTTYTSKLTATSESDASATESVTQATTVTDVDLSLAVTFTNLTNSDRSHPVPGDKVQFTYTLTNAGTGIATDVVIADPLPSTADVVFNDDVEFHNTSGCTVTPAGNYDSTKNTIAFTLDKLCGKTASTAGDMVVSWTYSVTVKSTTADNVVEPNTVLDGDDPTTEAEPDGPTLTFNDTDGTTGQSGPADNTKGIPTVGTLYDFTLNAVPASTDPVTVVSLIPSGTQIWTVTLTNTGNKADTYNASSAWRDSDSKFSLTPDPDCTAASYTLNPGATLTCDATLKVDGTAVNAEDDQITSSFTNTGTSAESPATKTLSVSLGVLVTSPDVQLGISAVVNDSAGNPRASDDQKPAPGDRIDYTVTATNNGAIPAKGTVIEIPIPNDTTYLKSDPAHSVKVDLGGTQLNGVAAYDNNTPGTITVTLGNGNDIPANGGVLTITFSVTVNDYATTAETTGSPSGS